MSDILIRGMEMPKDGSCIQIVIDDDGKAYPSVEKCILKMGSIATAVPVPPHRRLIDADALAYIFRCFIAMYESCPFSQLATTDKARRDELQSALAEVINAPTVIPAEEGE